MKFVLLLVLWQLYPYYRKDESFVIIQRNTSRGYGVFTRDVVGRHEIPHHTILPLSLLCNSSLVPFHSLSPCGTKQRRYSQHRTLLSNAPMRSRSHASSSFFSSSCSQCFSCPSWNCQASKFPGAMRTMESCVLKLTHFILKCTANSHRTYPRCMIPRTSSRLLLDG